MKQFLDVDTSLYINKLKGEIGEMSKIFAAKKLKILRNKTKAVTIALVLILAITATIVVLPAVEAHDPSWTIKT
jgi:hypothetical protein